MPPIEPGDDRWPSRKDRLLADVYGRGASMRRQRQLRLALAVTVAVVLLVAVPALALQGSSSPRAVNTIGEPPTTTSETTPEGVVVPETTTTTATTTTRPSTTTTALVCRNSYNPKCGDFRWDPQPVNQPMTATLTFSPANPTTGQNVHFQAIVDDPDGNVSEYGSWMYGDDEGGTTVAIPGCVPPPQRYGPWDPPAPTPGHREVGFDHVYTNPGPFTAEFGFSGFYPCTDFPYASGVTQTVTVSVTGPPLTTTTTVTR